MSKEEMVARLLSEDRLTPAEAGKLVGVLECGATVSPCTILRWCLRGVRKPDGTRLYLEHFRAGGRYATSRQALVRFLAAQTGGPEPGAAVRTPTERRRACERATAELDAMGV